MSRCLAKIFGQLYEESRSLESQTSDLLPESQRSAARHGWQPLLPGGRPGSPVAGPGLGAGSPNSRSDESPPARSSASSRSVSSDAQRHRYRDYVIDIQAAIALLDPGQGGDCIAAVERHKALSQVSLRKRALQPSRSRRWTLRRMSAARSRPPPQCCGGRLRGHEDVAEYDAFLSYNWRDKDAVRAIARQLRERGLRPWMDERQLRPGAPWQPELEEIITHVPAAAVFGRRRVIVYGYV